jgi:hypothetical protein
VTRDWGKWLALLIAALLIPLASAGAQPSTRIVAVGDLHGDYAAYSAIMVAAGLVDRRGRWAGGRTIFVQTGDVPDRGPDSRRIQRDLMRLQREAARAGGRVVALVGNHEAMNVTGDLRYVHPGEYAAFADARSVSRREQVYEANRAAIEAGYRSRDPALTFDAIRRAWLASVPLGMVEHRAAWAPDGELGRWVAANPAVALIDGTLFAHGGIGAAYANMPIEEINRRAAAELTARDESPTALINDPAGPLWYRGLIERDGLSREQADQAIEAELGQVLGAYGARRIVVGHTPNLSGIAIRHGGRLIAIDTGISAHYGGRRSWLEIVDGNVVAHVVGGDAP